MVLLFSEKEWLKATEREIYSCNKIIWLAQSDLTEKQQECNQLNMAISLLVSECHHFEFELLKAGEERKLNGCEMMMKKHAVKVREQEKTLPLQEELKYLYSHMEDLKTHSMYIYLVVRSWVCYNEAVSPNYLSKSGSYGMAFYSSIAP